MPSARTKAWQGMNWIRQSTRLAIYLRDGLACCYCGQGVEDGAKLTLDHVIPHSRGGMNEPGNLVTSCERCNKSRGNRDAFSFCEAVASYLNHGITPDQIYSHVYACRVREIRLFRLQALKLIKLRGSCFKALYPD